MAVGTAEVTLPCSGLPACRTNDPDIPPVAASPRWPPPVRPNGANPGLPFRLRLKLIFARSTRLLCSVPRKNGTSPRKLVRETRGPATEWCVRICGWWSTSPEATRAKASACKTLSKKATSVCCGRSKDSTPQWARGSAHTPATGSSNRSSGPSSTRARRFGFRRTWSSC